MAPNEDDSAPHHTETHGTRHAKLSARHGYKRIFFPRKLLSQTAQVPCHRTEAIVCHRNTLWAGGSGLSTKRMPDRAETFTRYAARVAPEPRATVRYTLRPIPYIHKLYRT